MGEPEKAGLIFRLRYESEELQETTNAEASLRILCCVKTVAASSDCRDFILPPGNRSGQSMNTQYFIYAIEVEKTGSITQAANNLFMSQPTLSKAIRDMESSVGFPVFKRRNS